VAKKARLGRKADEGKRKWNANNADSADIANN
jgi:hypothetical protein